MASSCGDVKKSFVQNNNNLKQIKPSASGITITNLAAEKIQHFLLNENKNSSEFALHISVKKNGCSGYSYEMKMALISECLKNECKHFEHNNAHVMIAKTSYIFVIGSHLDYTEALTGSGFTLTNPNASKYCSCGASFGI